MVINRYCTRTIIVRYTTTDGSSRTGRLQLTLSKTSVELDRNFCMNPLQNSFFFFSFSRVKALSMRRFKRFEEKRSKPIKVWAENVWCHPHRSNPSPSTCEVEAKAMSYQGDNPLVLQPSLKLKAGMATVSSSKISTITYNVYISELSNVFAFSHLLYKHRLVRCKGDKQINKHDCRNIADTNRLLT